MGRRRIWLIIIGILIAGVSITWAVERFVSSRGVDTAAVVGFEADALPQGPVDAGNPYAVENRMKAAGTPDPQAPEDAEVSALAMAENEMAVEESETGAAAENAAKDLQASEETEKSPLETGSAVSEAQKNEKSAAEYTLSDFKERLETARTEAEKYQDDPSMSQTSRYAAAEYVRNLWDRELNIIYAEIHKAMDENAAESLRHEEVEWIKKRDLAADKASAKRSGTPAQSVEYVRTSANMTMDRCYELLKSYGDYLEPGEDPGEK